MLTSTSEAEPSELVQASPYLMSKWTYGFLPADEIERQARDALRLKEAYSSIPWHAQGAERDPDYWVKFLQSRINVYSQSLVSPTYSTLGPKRQATRDRRSCRERPCSRSGPE